MEPGLHVARFLKYLKSTFLSVKKIKIKTLHVDNIEIYQCANFKSKFCIILGYTKMTNLSKFHYFQMVYYIQIHIQPFLFLT